MPLKASWTSRGHRYLPFSPRSMTSFLSHTYRAQRSFCSSSIFVKFRQHAHTRHTNHGARAYTHTNHRARAYTTKKPWTYAHTNHITRSHTDIEIITRAHTLIQIMEHAHTQHTNHHTRIHNMQIITHEYTICKPCNMPTQHTNNKTRAIPT